MPRNRPTASVKGQREWEWNRLQAARRSEPSAGDGSAGRAETQRNHTHTQNCHEHVRTLKAEIHKLETELERTECQRQAVIERYERLLRTKNRKLSSNAESSESENNLPTPIAEFLQHVTDR